MNTEPTDNKMEKIVVLVANGQVIEVLTETAKRVIVVDYDVSEENPPTAEFFNEPAMMAEYNPMKLDDVLSGELDSFNPDKIYING